MSQTQVQEATDQAAEEALGTRFRYTKEEVDAALRRCGGQVPGAAEALGCSNQTVYNYIGLYPELKGIRNRVRRYRSEHVPKDQQERIRQRLEKLHEIPDEDMFIVGKQRYLLVEPIALLLGKSRQTISNWCRAGTVFADVVQSPERYNGCWMIPYESVEKAIKEDDFPRSGPTGNKKK